MTKLLNYMRKKIVSKEFENIESLKDKPNDYFHKGRKVMVIDNLPYVKTIQNKRGGWTSEMEKCIGTECTVVDVDFDGHIIIATPTKKSWYFNKAALTEVNKDVGKDIFTAIADNNIDLFIELLTPETLNIKNEDEMTLINFACLHKKIQIITYLIKFEADVQIPNKKGDFPVHTSALQKDLESLMLLIYNFPETIFLKRSNGETLIDIANKTNDKCLIDFVTNQTDKNSNNQKDEISRTVDDSDSMEKILGFSLCDPPMTFYELKEEIKIQTRIYSENDDNFNSLRLLQVPIDDQSLSKSFYFKTTNSDSPGNKTIKCFQCKGNVINYRAKCGHCFCSKCFTAKTVCSQCKTVLQENYFKIYV